MICPNCGRPVSPATKMCDYCGADYNNYDATPKCDHLYNQYQIDYEDDPCSMCVGLYLKCQKCGEVTKLNCTHGMLMELISRSETPRFSVSMKIPHR